MNETILTAALGYHALGWSVLPLCPSDHVGVGKEHRGCKSPGKRPFFPDRPNRTGEWKEFQTVPATEAHLRNWWRIHPLLNVGVALGPVSGMVGIDVDDEEGNALLLEMSGDDLPATWEYTTGKGRRLLYRLPTGVPVVNHSFSRPGTEIEILRFMSQGGQVVLPPSIHPNGSVYRWLPGRSPGDGPAADVPEWLRGEAHAENGTAYRPVDGELITEGGRNNYLTSMAGAMRKRGADEYVITAALTAINETRCDPMLAVAEIAAIARSVSSYAPDEYTGVTFKTPQPGQLPTPPPGDRKFKWASELSAPPKADSWLWEGYLPKAAITLLSALWKAGKTTLLSHLLKAFAMNEPFLGQPCRASKVLYVSEEGEQHWVRRRDDLGLGDHVGFYLQPFAAKPLTADWLGFLGGLKADVLAHGFDLIVFDTLAKLWPVTEENDAGQVDAALMPLWEITKAGAGVLLIHHLRKSGGNEYTGSRGSGAISAFPDIIIELTRFDATDHKSRKRVLRAKGRYDETPDEIVMELIGTSYVRVQEPIPGERQSPISEDGRVTVNVPEPSSEDERLVWVLANSVEPWMTSDDIRTALRERGWGMRDKDVSTCLFSLYNRAQLLMRGKARSKKDPRQFKLVSRRTPEDDLRPPPSCGGNEMWAGDDFEIG